MKTLHRTTNANPDVSEQPARCSRSGFSARISRSRRRRRKQSDSALRISLRASSEYAEPTLSFSVRVASLGVEWVEAGPNGEQPFLYGLSVGDHVFDERGGKRGGGILPYRAIGLSAGHTGRVVPVLITIRCIRRIATIIRSGVRLFKQRAGRAVDSDSLRFGDGILLPRESGQRRRTRWNLTGITRGVRGLRTNGRKR